MLIQKEPTKTGTRQRQPLFTIIRPEPVFIEVKKARQPRKKVYLLPPVTEFNTGYLKERKHDPL